MMERQWQWQRLRSVVRVRRWLFSGSLCIGSALAAEGSLQDKRLFFTQSERTASAKSAVTLAAPVDRDERDEAAHDGIVTIAMPDRVGIRFSAWVAGAAQIHVLVNGVPCTAIPRSELDRGSARIALRCPHIGYPRVRLAWVPVVNQLAVTVTGGRTIKLVVGERL